MNQIYLNHVTRFLARWFEVGTDLSLSAGFAKSLREFSDENQWRGA